MTRYCYLICTICQKLLAALEIHVFLSADDTFIVCFARAEPPYNSVHAPWCF